MYKIYTTKYVNAISLICTIIVFSLMCIISTQFESVDTKNIIKVEFKNVEIDKTSPKYIEKKSENGYNKSN